MIYRVQNNKKRLVHRLFIISLASALFTLGMHIAAFAFWEDPEATDQFTRATDDGATIGLNMYAVQGTPQDAPIVCFHGWNSDGSIWKNSQADYVKELQEQGYDVIVVDTRRNVEDEADLGPRGWLYGFEDSAYDVKAAISEVLEWYNNPPAELGLTPRHYTHVQVITHSDGFTKVSEYTRSSFYQDDIKEIYSLNPPVFGTNGYIALGKSIFLPFNAYIVLKDGKIKKPGSSGYESLWETQQVMFKSDYIRTKGSFGPQENIPIYISVFENDNIVDPLSQFLWRRVDEAIYEYCQGGHYGYTNKDALSAIIDKLNNGPYSAYFNKKPYGLYAMFVGEEFLKQRYPNLTSPANDHPDDTYDVSTASLDTGILLYDFLSYYNRLAIKKHKVFFPRYCQNLDLFRQAQDAYDSLPAGNSDEQFLAEWENMLSQANAYNEQNANLVKDDLNNLPDVAILFQGYYAQAAKLALEQFKEPVRIVTVDFSHSLPQKVLVIPSGGLYGLDSSDIFKVKLEEYVKAGGTLICLAQQHGYEFSALPGGEVGGYGWLEDQSCHSAAAYIDTYHQVLSGQTQTTPDLSIDGYFSNYPEDTTVLLRRTANGQPCMIMYPYGQGRVIATTMYEDWAYGQAQSTAQGRALIRDIISWAKEPEDLPEYSPGDSVSLQLTVNSLQDNQEEATQVELYILNPDREIVDST